MVYIVCASAVISPLKQWLDSYGKTRLKMCHTSKHFIHMQYFLLLTNLVIVFVHWVSTGVLYELRLHCFGTIFPNLNFVFASISAACLVHIQSDQYRSCSTVKQRRADAEQPKTVLWLWVREMTWYLYTRWVRGRMKANNADLKLLENCVMNGSIMFGIMFMTATGLENSPRSFDVYTVSQSRSVVTSAENPAPKNSPQSIGELGNGHVAYYTRLVRQMAW